MTVPTRLLQPARAPSPPVYICEGCGREASFGGGPPTYDRQHWWCRGCAPASFWQRGRAA